MYDAKAARPPAARPSTPPHTDHPCIAPPTRPPQGKKIYEYKCCPDDGSNQGEECGDFGVDFGILQCGNYCTSPDGMGGYNCWAGTDVERCTCSRGSARMTGNSEYYEV